MMKNLVFMISFYYYSMNRHLCQCFLCFSSMGDIFSPQDGMDALSIHPAEFKRGMSGEFFKYGYKIACVIISDPIANILYLHMGI